MIHQIIVTWHQKTVPASWYKSLIYPDTKCTYSDSTSCTYSPVSWYKKYYILIVLFTYSPVSWYKTYCILIVIYTFSPVSWSKKYCILIPLYSPVFWWKKYCILMLMHSPVFCKLRSVPLITVKYYNGGLEPLKRPINWYIAIPTLGFMRLSL